jgi:uncharacterized protein YecE (DUF72 family)
LQRASRTPAKSQDIPSTSTLFTGTSGWAYPSWKPGFYPKVVRARDFLAYYGSQLNSVEVNYTFRTLPTADQLKGWMTAAPKPFRFTFKAPQGITHFKRLRDCEDAVLAFLDAIEPVRKAKQLGVLLFQLPPNFKADLDRLEAFLKLRAFKRKGLQLSFEFRHESWLSEATFDLMHARNAALCVADGDELQVPDVTTATFRSYRLRKSGGYTDAEIEQVAGRLSKAVPAGDTFVYLRHEEQPAGPLSAVHLLESSCTLDGRKVR